MKLSIFKNKFKIVVSDRAGWDLLGQAGKAGILLQGFLTSRSHLPAY
jgi:hypothetical protein